MYDMSQPNRVACMVFFDLPIFFLFYYNTVWCQIIFLHYVTFPNNFDWNDFISPMCWPLMIYSVLCFQNPMFCNSFSIFNWKWRIYHHWLEWITRPVFYINSSSLKFEKKETISNTRIHTNFVILTPPISSLYTAQKPTMKHIIKLKITNHLNKYKRYEKTKKNDRGVLCNNHKINKYKVKNAW